jgi:acylphosphatase
MVRWPWIVSRKYNRRVLLTARRFTVRGRVQGVGFRFFASERAALDGLAGWVRNTTEGTVEAEAEGERDAVDRFERALRHGPAGSRVDSVDAVDIPVEHRRGFEVRR